MSDPANAYRVLARKYRPQTFAELIGQEAVVRTLANAIATGRIAHAFILTGVRGVGKTTTARIIARALNCVGPDGTGGPTAAPCGECIHCRSIAEDRHVDVIEMDAASRTGVDDIRELTDGVRYRPVSARYKIYIIDEVHMLSKNAFNALLKTLEEPPPAVIFVFATTEIHKVPVTVLSRCQRFSLRRVPAEMLAEHYRRVADAEAVEAEPEALALIARAADGSVRDGLSLLDQAIALSGGRVAEAAVRDMLGVADRGLVFDLLETVLRGEAAAALAQFDRLYQEGADPLLVLQDLLDLAHFLTRLKLAPEAGAGDPIAEGDRERARPLAEKLTMSALARVWQMLLKGLGEVQEAPSPIQAAEMVLVRLAYVADLPSPAELVRSLQGQPVARRAGAARRAERTATAPPPRREVAPPVAAAVARPSAGGPLRASVELAEAELEAAPSAPSAPTARGVGADAAELRRGRGAVRQTARGGAALASRGPFAPRAFRAGADRVSPGAGRAARPRQPPRPAIERMDGCALADRGIGGRGRTHAAPAPGTARSGIAERGCRAPVGAGGARNVSGGDHRGGARALCRRGGKPGDRRRGAGRG